MTTAPSSVFARASPGAPRRSRRVRGAAGWAFLLAATLAFKSFVPMLAALSAGMQGKAVADVCALYGVRLAPAADPDAASHAMHHLHGAAAAATDPAGSPAHEHPADHAEHARDHCALTALAVGAVFAATLWGLVDWRAVPVTGDRFADPIAPSRDASARWLTLRLHAPPARA